MIILQFLLFNSLIYFLGRGILELISFFSKSKIGPENVKIFGINLNFFYPIIGLFFIGNFVTVLNFFTGVDRTWVYMIFLLILLLNFNRINSLKFSILGFLNYFLIPTILSVSTINIGIHGDAHLYQFNYQNWIRSEKIALGLTNISARFGYASMYDPISSVFWINNNAVYFHFLNLVFFVIFFNFLTINILNRKNSQLFFASYFLLIFGVLDNFGFSGGRNGFIYIEGIGKQDVAFAVIFFITNMLIITSFAKSEFSELEFRIASIMVLFSAQLRLLGILSLLPLLYWYFKVFDFKKQSLYKNMKLFILPTLLGIIWIVKNILITGCIVFPVSERLCFDQLSWYIPGTATVEAWVIADFFYGLSTEDGLVAWYNHWMSSPFNAAIAKNFVFSFLILLSLKFIFLSNKNKFSIKDSSFLLIYVVLNFYPWLNSGPAIRFGMGFFMLVIGILGFGDFEYRFLNPVFKIAENKIVLILLIVMCTFLIPRLGKYKEFAADPIYFPIIESETIDTMPNPSGWGVTPAFGSECNINIDCIPYAVGTKLYINSYGYKVFK